MKTKLSFANPSLQKISDESGPIVSNHLQDLDRISNDIKVLEEELKLAAIPFIFLFVLSSEEKTYEKPVEETKLRCEYIGEFIQQTDNCLVWGKNEAGDYLLSYNVYTTEDEVESCHDESRGGASLLRYNKKTVSNGEHKLSNSTRLIETKSNFRLKIEKELTFFYEMIIEALKTKRDQERVIEYSKNRYMFPVEYARMDSRFFC